MSWLFRGGLLFCICVIVVGVFTYAMAASGIGDRAEREESGATESKALEGDLWHSAYCPRALPAEDNPYVSMIKKYAEEGQTKKLEHAQDEMNHYQSCAQASRSGATGGLQGNKAYQQALETNDPGTAEVASKEAAAQRLKGGVAGSFVSKVIDKSFDLAYANPGNRPTQPEIEKIMRQTFCECLNHPTDEFLREEN